MSDRLDVRKTYKLLVNGAFPRSESGRSYEVTDANGRFLANVAQGSRKDIRDAVVAARAAQAKWWSATAYNRGQVIYRLAEVAESRRGELAEHVALAEGLKPKAARDSVARAIDRAVWYAGWTDKVAQVFGSSNPVAGPFFNFSVPTPSGVVGVLAEQNSSLEAFVDAVLAPICVGNTVVAVASERRPTPAVLLGEMTASSDFPAGVLNIVTGVTGELAPVLAAHEDVDGLELSALTRALLMSWRSPPQDRLSASCAAARTDPFVDYEDSSRPPRSGTRLASSGRSLRAGRARRGAAAREEWRRPLRPRGRAGFWVEGRRRRPRCTDERGVDLVVERLRDADGRGTHGRDLDGRDRRPVRRARLGTGAPLRGPQRQRRCVHPVRTAIAAGATRVVLTNASGGIDPSVAPGSVVVIRDHINCTGTSPLEGAPPPAPYGSRFVDLTDLYSERLRQVVRGVAPELTEGVYLGFRGPHYETPAEIAMARTIGASLVGMSTVLEAIAARHLGAEVLGLSLVSNFAAGVAGRPLSHLEVLETGQSAAASLGVLLANVLPAL